ERLDASAPRGVNLTGEWNFDPNLSDDPSKLGEPDNTPQRAPGSHRGRGGGRGGGGMPPVGPSPTGSSGAGGYNYLPVAQMTQLPGNAPGSPPAGSPPSGRRPSLNLPKAPQHLSITQQDKTVTIRTNMPDGTQTADDYTAGTSTKIPYGQDSVADRSVGWRGPVFVITTSTKKDGWREDDFAIDDDGRLIMTTDTKGGRLGKLEIKRVYDRARGAQ
ncbi:MAG: hypothetical protein JO042_15590, partial [Sinobacteraceae bacterium]|nr:hypothetical protein [Nevskiaceae bacterium]